MDKWSWTNGITLLAMRVAWAGLLGGSASSPSPCTSCQAASAPSPLHPHRRAMALLYMASQGWGYYSVGCMRDMSAYTCTTGRRDMCGHTDIHTLLALCMQSYILKFAAVSSPSCYKHALIQTKTCANHKMNSRIAYARSYISCAACCYCLFQYNPRAQFLTFFPAMITQSFNSNHSCTHTLALAIMLAVAPFSSDRHPRLHAMKTILLRPPGFFTLLPLAFNLRSLSCLSTSRSVSSSISSTTSRTNTFCSSCG